jgi:hypothetical protein
MVPGRVRHHHRAARAAQVVQRLYAAAAGLRGARDRHGHPRHIQKKDVELTVLNNMKTVTETSS